MVLLKQQQLKVYVCHITTYFPISDSILGSNCSYTSSLNSTPLVLFIPPRYSKCIRRVSFFFFLPLYHTSWYNRQHNRKWRSTAQGNSVLHKHRCNAIFSGNWEIFICNIWPSHFTMFCGRRAFTVTLRIC